MAKVLLPLSTLSIEILHGLWADSVLCLWFVSRLCGCVLGFAGYPWASWSPVSHGALLYWLFNLFASSMVADGGWVF